MKKTALTQLIEILEQQSERMPIPAYQKGLEYAKQAAINLKEVERQDLEDAYDKGIGAIHPTGHGMSFDEYFNETFKQ